MYTHTCTYAHTHTHTGTCTHTLKHHSGSPTCLVIGFTREGYENLSTVLRTFLFTRDGDENVFNILQIANVQSYLRWPLSWLWEYLQAVVDTVVSDSFYVMYISVWLYIMCVYTCMHVLCPLRTDEIPGTGVIAGNWTQISSKVASTLNHWVHLM